MESSLTEQAADFLTYFQQLEFSLADLKNDPSGQSDIYRNLYLHLMTSPLVIDRNKSNRFPSLRPPWCEEAKYMEKYAELVDNMDGDGLNNFAEGALALCNFHRNESASWKSSLTVDEVLEACAHTSDKKDGPEDNLDDTVLSLEMSKSKLSIPQPMDGFQGMKQGSTTEVGASIESNQLSSDVLGHSGAVMRATNPRKSILASTPMPASSTSMPASSTSTNSWFSRGQNDLVSPGMHYGPYTNTLELTTIAPVLTPVHQQASEYSRNMPSPFLGPFMANNIQQHCRPEVNSAPHDALVNAAKVGGPYANFGQKPKSSFWSNIKEKRNEGKRWINEDEDDDNSEDRAGQTSTFRTAKEQLVINQQKKFGSGSSSGYDRSQVVGTSYGAGRKSLGTRRGPASKFVPPILNKESDENDSPRGGRSSRLLKADEDDGLIEEPVDERLKGIEPKMIELINNEIMDHGTPVTWSDIAGLEFAKKTIKEIVVWPLLRPDIFTGLRGPPKGLLLFGPPGTGKTLIGKCIASQSRSTFFCISASSLTSKWVGEGEKMVRALFAVARCHQPAVVFIDEIDSLLSQRSDSEHESSRRIKTEFLVQLDGAATNADDRILVIGATNRPHEIDEAARRRFVKRLLIPLPETVARRQIVLNLMSQQNAHLTEQDVQNICDKTEGYSGADMTNLCREAALGPIRSIPFELMETVTPEQVRPISYQDFEAALLQVRASVSSKDLELYTNWNQTFGSFGQ